MRGRRGWCPMLKRSQSPIQEPWRDTSCHHPTTQGPNVPSPCYILRTYYILYIRYNCIFDSDMVDSDSSLHQHTYIYIYIYIYISQTHVKCKVLIFKFQTLALAFIVAASALHPVHPLTTVSALSISGHSCPASCNAFLSILAHHPLSIRPSFSLSLGVLTWSASWTLSNSSWDKQNSSSNTSSQDMARSQMGLLTRCSPNLLDTSSLHKISVLYHLNLKVLVLVRLAPGTHTYVTYVSYVVCMI